MHEKEKNAWKKNKQKGQRKTRWTQNLKENKINGYKEKKWTKLKSVDIKKKKLKI